jgi:hypothetical protein
MKTPHSTLFRYSAETIAHANRITVGVVNEQAHKQGMMEGEPLTVAMDCMLKYAEAYRERYEAGLAEDYVLGDCWRDAIKGLKGLLDGDGAIAMRRGITTDSKDNGALDSLYHDALRVAGFTPEGDRKENQ